MNKYVSSKKWEAAILLVAAFSIFITFFHVVYPANPTYRLIAARNLLVYFTVQSNILIFFLYLLMFMSNKKSSNFASCRGAITLYISMTGFIFFLLLRHTMNWRMNLATTSNFFLHYVVPPLVLLHWIVNPPNKKINYYKIGYWLIYPLCYLVMVFIVAKIMNYYPYPFVDASKIGLFGVIKNAAFLLAIFGASGALLIYYSNRRR